MCVKFLLRCSLIYFYAAVRHSSAQIILKPNVRFHSKVPLGAPKPDIVGLSRQLQGAHLTPLPTIPGTAAVGYYYPPSTTSPWTEEVGFLPWYTQMREASATCYQS